MRVCLGLVRTNNYYVRKLNEKTFFIVIRKAQIDAKVFTDKS